MADKLFIDKTAFEQYKDVSEHLDADMVNAIIGETQLTDLIGVIGAPLYKLLQDDFTAPGTWATPKYEELFNGATYVPQGQSYEVIYHGLQPMLTLYAYARMLNNLQLQVTRTGPVTYMEGDISESSTQAQIKTKVIEARAVAVRYEEEVTEYLRTNKADFPEWRDMHTQNKAFQFIKI